MRRKRYEFYKKAYRQERKRHIRRKVIEIASSIALAGALLKWGCRPILEKILDYQQSQHALRTQAIKEDKSETNEPNAVYKETRCKTENLEKKAQEVKKGVEIRELENVSETNSENYQKPQKISQKGIKLIKKYEGFSSVPYEDFGSYSVGYGHQIKDDEKFSKITEKEAENLLAKDLVCAEKTVAGNVSVPLTQNQYDALCSFVYNIGEGNFKKSTLLKKLNNRDYSGASEEFKRWNKAGGRILEGLKKRRESEKELFLSNHKD